jgi:transposase-like protein
LWIWYNKLDTKLREKGEQFMRKSFDRQFKFAAVRLIVEDQLPISQVSKELDVHRNSLYRWVREYEEHGENAFPGHGTALYSYQNEIKKLQRENQYLREELELLKKFRAFLKKKNV